MNMKTYFFVLELCWTTVLLETNVVMMVMMVLRDTLFSSYHKGDLIFLLSPDGRYSVIFVHSLVPVFRNLCSPRTANATAHANGTGVMFCS